MGSAPKRWIDGQGQEWACAAYDHGPMCRRCQPVDEILGGLFENVEQGFMTTQQEPDGTFSFALTAAGQIAAADLMATLRMEEDFDA